MIPSGPIWRTIWIAVTSLTAAGVCQAQADCVFKTVHVSKLHGVVMDQIGEVIPDAVVTLKRNGEVASETKTGGDGKSVFKEVSGAYDLGISAKGFKKAGSPVEIGPDVSSLLHSSLLRMMLLVGLREDCELFMTSKREFDRAVEINKQRFKGIDEKHATQK